jgi:DNA-binding response OmpR family regulator
MLKDKAVLIVEDNVYLAMDLCDEVAQLEGHAVGPVDTVAEALAIVDSQQIAAAVLDYDLPDGGVWQLAKRSIERAFLSSSRARSPLAPRSTELAPLW